MPADAKLTPEERWALRALADMANTCKWCGDWFYTPDGNVPLGGCDRCKPIRLLLPGWRDDLPSPSGAAIRDAEDAALERARVAAAAEQLEWRHSHQAWAACGNIANRISAIARALKSAGAKEQT